MHDHLSETAKHIGDALSAVIMLGTLSDMLPSVAALMTIIWTAIRIVETRTVQRWLGRK